MISKLVLIEKYGVDNVSKVKYLVDKMINTKIKNNMCVSEELLTDWQKYTKTVNNITKNTKRNFMKNGTE